MDILFAPVFAFFNLAFYKRILRASLGKGFLYLAYFSVIYSLAVVVLVRGNLMPQADEFAAWLTGELPQITITAEGVVCEAPQPYELVHPKFGKILAMDTTKEGLENPPPGFMLYITKNKALARQDSRNESRVYDLGPQTQEAKAQWKDVVITGQVINEIYKKIVPFVYPVTFGLVLVFAFIWKILAALFYSLAALIFNNFRREKLGYSRLLNASIFAMTPVWMIQTIGIFVPRLAVPLNFFTALILTAIYLFIALLATQEKQDSISSPHPAA